MHVGRLVGAGQGLSPTGFLTGQVAVASLHSLRFDRGPVVISFQRTLRELQAVEMNPEPSTAVLLVAQVYLQHVGPPKCF